MSPDFRSLLQSTAASLTTSPSDTLAWWLIAHILNDHPDTQAKIERRLVSLIKEIF